MDHQTFAQRFGHLYRELYLRAARRIDDARERLTPETVALLLHVDQAGPSTLSELSAHLERSMSTLSAKVGALESAGLLARQRDVHDARRALIWLSPEGRKELVQAMEVLDASRLASAASAWDADRRQRFVDELHALVEAIPPMNFQSGEPAP